LALRDGHQLDPGEAEAVVELGDVGKLAAEAVERLDEDDVEAAGREIGDEALVTRPGARGAAQRPVLGMGDDDPALLLGVAPADLDLILDRGLALQLARVPAVDDGAHKGLSSMERAIPSLYRVPRNDRIWNDPHTRVAEFDELSSAPTVVG